MMPGRNASSARPDRRAKTAAIAMPNREFSTNCGVDRCTIRSNSRTTREPDRDHQREVQVVRRDPGDGEADGRDGALDHPALATERLRELGAHQRLERHRRFNDGDFLRLGAHTAGCR